MKRAEEGNGIDLVGTKRSSRSEMGFRHVCIYDPARYLKHDEDELIMQYELLKSP